MSTLFKAMTRPAMIKGLGVPVTQFVITMMVLFFAGYKIHKMFYFLMPVAWYAMRELVRWDEHIFSQLYLKYKTRGRFALNRYFHATHFSGSDYDAVNIKRLEESMRLDKQAPIKDIVPYSSHVAENIIMTKRDDFVATWEIEGVFFDCEDERKIAVMADELNTLIRGFEGKNIVFYTHRIRNKIRNKYSFVSKVPVANTIMGAFYKSLNENDFFGNKLYLTVCYRPYALEDKLAKKVSKRSERRKMFRESMAEMKEICQKFDVSLKPYHAKALTTFSKGKRLYSEQLSLFQYLLSGSWQKVCVSDSPFYEYLGGKDIFFGHDSGQITASENAKYFRIIEIKDFFQNTDAGIFDALMYLPVEYVVTNSFGCMGRQETIKAFDDQIKMLSSNEDAAKSQIKALETGKDMVASGLMAGGHAHFSIMVLADTPDKLVNDTNMVTSALEDLGLVTSFSTFSLAAAFFAQLPTVYELRPRVSTLTSLNFTEMESFHNFYTGKKDGAPWGKAVMTLKASGGGEYHLNYHNTIAFKDQFGDDPPLAHSDIIGASDSGKTVFLMLNVMSVQQYGVPESFPENYPNKRLTTVVFDKDRATEPGIRAMGGEYYRVSAGEPTGWNMFQMEPTKRNIKTIKDIIILICNMKGEPLDPTQEGLISSAVDALMRRPREVRKYGITELCKNITEPKTAEFIRYGIHARLRAWQKGGEYGWIFDNENDTFDIREKDIFGIDGTEFLDDPVASQVIAYYLLYRVTSLADGRRLVIYMDEFHYWLHHPTVCKFVENILRTGRKLNIVLVFATQSPEELVKSPQSAALREQCATHIFMGNRKATEKDYIGGLKQQPHHFNIVKEIKQFSRQCLAIKNPQRKGESDDFAALFTVDLGEAAAWLPLLSASKASLSEFEKVWKEGMKPEEWVNEYIALTKKLESDKKQDKAEV